MQTYQVLRNSRVIHVLGPILTFTCIIERTNECLAHSARETQMKYISNNSSAFRFENTSKMYLQPSPNVKNPVFDDGHAHHCTKKHVCLTVYSRYMCGFQLSGLFISSSWLIKSKIKRQRGNNQKQNHAALKENSLQTDLSGRENCCYILHTEKKATSEITTQQTSYIINLQSWQAHLRRKSSFRENYLVLLLMPALVTKSWSRSIQFLQVCCRGSDFKLGNCMQRSVKLLKFQRNLWR